MPTPPELDLARIQRYCDAVVPPDVQGEVRVLMGRRGNTITILESRPVVPGDASEWYDVPAARMKYDPQTYAWTLFFFDRNSKAHRYEPLAPHQPIVAVLGEVERDPTGIFWG